MHSLCLCDGDFVYEGDVAAGACCELRLPPAALRLTKSCPLLRPHCSKLDLTLTPITTSSFSKQHSAPRLANPKVWTCLGVSKLNAGSSCRRVSVVGTAKSNATDGLLNALAAPNPDRPVSSWTLSHPKPTRATTSAALRSARGSSVHQLKHLRRPISRTVPRMMARLKAQPLRHLGQTPLSGTEVA